MYIKDIRSLLSQKYLTRLGELIAVEPWRDYSQFLQPTILCAYFIYLSTSDAFIFYRF